MAVVALAIVIFLIFHKSKGSTLKKLTREGERENKYKNNHEFSPRHYDSIEPAYEEVNQRPSDTHFKEETDVDDISEYSNVKIVNQTTFHSKFGYSESKQANAASKQDNEQLDHNESMEDHTYSVVDVKKKKQKQVEPQNDEYTPPPVPEQTTDMLYTAVVKNKLSGDNSYTCTEDAPSPPPQTIEMMFTEDQRNHGTDNDEDEGVPAVPPQTAEMTCTTLQVWSEEVGCELAKSSHPVL